VSGAYLINSEYVFKRGMMPMENMEGMEMLPPHESEDEMNGMKMEGMTMDSISHK
jgi:hypothetical protein